MSQDFCSSLKKQIKDEKEAQDTYHKMRVEGGKELGDVALDYFEVIIMDEQEHEQMLKRLAERMRCPIKE